MSVSPRYYRKLCAENSPAQWLPYPPSGTSRAWHECCRQNNLRIAHAVSGPQAERLARRLGANGVALIEAWYAHWLDPAQRPLDIRGEIGRITAPTLVIQGLDDEFATPAHAEGIARAIAGAELWLIPACRHAPQLEYPEAFNERVLGFLARH